MLKKKRRSLRIRTAHNISTNPMATLNAMISRVAQENTEQRGLVNWASLTLTSYRLPFSISSTERKGKREERCLHLLQKQRRVDFGAYIASDGTRTQTGSSLHSQLSKTRTFAKPRVRISPGDHTLAFNLY